MTHPIPPGLDRSPVGQWARATADKVHKTPANFAAFYISNGAARRAWLSELQIGPLLFPYLAFVPIGGTAIEERLRWEAEMMANHGETVPGLDGNPWIGWAKELPGNRVPDWVFCNDLVVILSGNGRYDWAFIRPDDAAREAELRAMLSDVPDLHPTREGSERALRISSAPAPERVELALQAGTLSKVETWEEHLLRRHAIIGLRRIADGKDIAEVQAEPAQHRLTIPPDTDPVMGSFWRK